MKKSVLGLASILLLIALLAQPALSFQGARTGLLLWFDVVLPTLFPFMICSGLIVSYGGVPLLIKPVKPILKAFFSLSEYGSYAMITGILCGYPMGAKLSADFFTDHKITRRESQYLLAISSFPSPMFIAGYVYAQMHTTLPVGLLFLSLYLPILPMAWLARTIYGVNGCETNSFQEMPACKPFDQMLMDSMEIMAKIGGYIMLFSIAALYVNTLLPGWFPCKSLLTGVLEMTTGIHQLSLSQNLFFGEAAILATAAFGGLSGAAQTKTVIKNAGLSIRHYVAWKWLHCLLAGLTLILLQVYLLPQFR